MYNSVYTLDILAVFISQLLQLLRSSPSADCRLFVSVNKCRPQTSSSELKSSCREGYGWSVESRQGWCDETERVVSHMSSLAAFKTLADVTQFIISIYKSYWNCFWYCSGQEQRRFGLVAEHFLFCSQNMQSIFYVLSETVNGCVWQLVVTVYFEVPDAARRRPPISPTATVLGGVGGRPQRLLKDLALMPLQNAYHILLNRYRRSVDTDSPMF